MKTIILIIMTNIFEQVLSARDCAKHLTYYIIIVQVPYFFFFFKLLMSKQTAEKVKKSFGENAWPEKAEARFKPDVSDPIVGTFFFSFFFF